jgi:hypothetical protein
LDYTLVARMSIRRKVHVKQAGNNFLAPAPAAQLGRGDVRLLHALLLVKEGK